MVIENHSSEGQDSSPYLPHSSSTKKKQGGWKAVKFILGNETFEKLASMSLIANLIVYMHTQYNIENANSVEVFNIWSGFTNFLPLVGAYVADAYVGKFNMLLFGSIASLLGMGFMALGAGIPSLRPPSCPTHSDCVHPTGMQLGVLYLGLGLFSIGSGGLRPCNIAFGADQFDTKTEKGRAQLESFCNWWYFLFTVALLLALTGVVYIQTNVSWFIGFVIPTACFALSLTIFMLGQSTYVRMKPKGSIISNFVKVVVAANKKRHVDLKKDSELSFYDPPQPASSESEPKHTKLAQTNRFRNLDKAAVITDPSERDVNGEPIDGWRLCSVQQVEELKSILTTIPVWVAGIICFLSMGQGHSFGILQALQTSKSIGPHFIIPPAWMGLVPMIALSMWIFLYEKIYIPWTMKTTKEGKRLSIEHRILIGIMFSIVSMVVSGLVEVRRRDFALRSGSFESPIGIWWLVPQFALSGLVEAFAAIPMMELLTSYWPESVKTLGGAVFFLSISIASYLGTILIRVILVVTNKYGKTPWLGGNDLNKNRLEYFYYTIAVLGGLNLLYFQFFARSYLRTELVQRPGQNEPEDEENVHKK
ncbi:protein NRT1/ PTR FAMILY 2.8-like [Lotus japonicus]|uniref:protein NRT1/ PTR FAMILY 2.8-like n=1 Tax=Lotus japonicus TaxID=34305 RepID=UPI00258FA520|nr:protein NRT1/ PTR FAMILY 2.8-like [Lotus japonicus]